jgi:hypothetical protein
MNTGLGSGGPAGRDRLSSDEMSDDVLRRQVREALSRLDDLAFLEMLTLSHLVRSGSSSHLASRGHALRQALLNAIQRLGAQRGGKTGSRQALGNRILTLRYREGLAPSTIARRLDLSRSAYYREEKRTTEAVTSMLWEKPAQDGAATGHERGPVAALSTGVKLGNVPIPSAASLDGSRRSPISWGGSAIRTDRTS